MDNKDLPTDEKKRTRQKESNQSINAINIIPQSGMLLSLLRDSVIIYLLDWQESNSEEMDFIDFLKFIGVILLLNIDRLLRSEKKRKQLEEEFAQHWAALIYDTLFETPELVEAKPVLEITERTEELPSSSIYFYEEKLRLLEKTMGGTVAMESFMNDLLHYLVREIDNFKNYKEYLEPTKDSPAFLNDLLNLRLAILKCGFHLMPSALVQSGRFADHKTAVRFIYGRIQKSKANPHKQLDLFSFPTGKVRIHLTKKEEMAFLVDMEKITQEYLYAYIPPRSKNQTSDLTWTGTDDQITELAQLLKDQTQAIFQSGIKDFDSEDFLPDHSAGEFIQVIMSEPDADYQLTWGASNVLLFYLMDRLEQAGLIERKSRNRGKDHGVAQRFRNKRGEPIGNESMRKARKRLNGSRNRPKGREKIDLIINDLIK